MSRPRGTLVHALGLGVLLLIATGFALGLLEITSRVLDGMPLTTLRLPPPPALVKSAEPSLANRTRALAHAEGVDPEWIDQFPPPLANRKPPDPSLLALRVADGGRARLESELYRQWNARFVAEIGCSAGGPFKYLPTPLTIFHPSQPDSQPVFRYYPGVSTPIGLVTNQFGWRGPEIPLNKPAGTVRIAFVGASTTVGGHQYPFSYPEYVGHWLNLWAEHTGQPVHFDIINAGREGISSNAIAAIVRQELPPAEPDLVVYYEGANQFRFPSLIDIPVTPPRSFLGPTTGFWPTLTATLRPYSALSRRVRRALEVLRAEGSEPRKPPYQFTWPAGVDEFHPDLASRALPLQLPMILADLESMRTTLDRIGAELAVSSFVWLVSDGMTLRSQQDILIYNLLNEGWWPLRYRDMRRMADFQNRVFAQYAAAHHLLFVDVAAAMPTDPDLFHDAIHFKAAGIRMQAWSVFNAILPRIRERLAAGTWPRPDREQATLHPGIPAALTIPGCPK